MSNVQIAHKNLIDDADDLTATPTEANFPDDNLQLMQPSRRWRTSSMTGITILIDFGSAMAWNLVSLIATNATTNTTWRIRAGTTASTTDFDSGTIDFWPKNGLEDWLKTSGFYVPSSPQTYRWMQINITDAGHPDGYFEAGRLFVAEAWEPAINMEWNWGIGYKDASKRQRALSGRAFVTPHDKYKVMNFTLGFQSEAEMFGKAINIDRLNGEAKDVLVIPDVENTTYIEEQYIHGLLTSLQPIVNNRYQIFRKGYKVEELI